MSQSDSFIFYKIFRKEQKNLEDLKEVIGNFQKHIKAMPFESHF